MGYHNRFRGRGRRREPGRMNNTERAYETHLEHRKRAGEVLQYQFEAVKVRLADKTWFTPDFLVLLADLTLELHDVKGTKTTVERDEFGRVVSRSLKPLVEEDANVKIKVAGENLPFVFKTVFRGESGFWVEHEV